MAKIDSELCYRKHHAPDKFAMRMRSRRATESDDMLVLEHFL